MAIPLEVMGELTTTERAPVLGYIETENQRYTVTDALPEDLDILVEFREHDAERIAEMPDTGDMWQKWYPDKPTATKRWAADIEAGKVFVARDDNGEVIAGITLTEDANPMLWTKRERMEALFVSRLVRRLPSHEDDVDEHKGVGRGLLNWAEEEAMRYGKRFVRLDVWAKNEPLQRQYMTWGYQCIPSKRWHDYPSYNLFQKEVSGAEDAKAIRPYEGCDVIDICNGDVKPFDPRQLPDLTPSILSKWREGTLYDWYKNNWKKAPLYLTSMDGGFLRASHQTGGDYVRERVNTNASRGILNANVCDLLSKDQQTTLVTVVGLANFLVQERVNPGSGNSTWADSRKFARHLFIRAIERPAEDTESFTQAFTRYRAQHFEGDGVLVRGIFNGGKLEIEGQYFNLESPLHTTSNAKEDVVVNRYLRPPSSNEFGMQPLDPQTLQDGDYIMARFTVPPVDPGEVSRLQATVLKVELGIPNTQRQKHLVRLVINSTDVEGEPLIEVINTGISENSIEAH
jgi:GNAT superfamily N-acetyltransferase